MTALLAYCSTLNSYKKQYKHGEQVFEPFNNVSRLNLEKAEQLLPVSLYDRPWDLITITGHDGSSILTIDAFKEMIEFDEALRTEIWKQEGDSRRLFYDDICDKFNPQKQISHASCRRDPLPIDFVWNEENGSYDLERYATTDKELIKHIQNGKTERALYRVENDVLILDRIFGTIAPENFYQNTIDG